MNNDRDNDRHKIMTWPCHEQNRKCPDVLNYTTILPRYTKRLFL